MTIQIISDVLMWCSVINVGLLIFSFIILTTLRSFVYRMHSKLFPMSEQQFDAIIYSGFMIHKILIIMFNIVPYLAVSIVME